MSLVIADSRPESLTLIAAQHEDWIIQQAITLLENRVFKAGPALGSPAAVRDYLRLKLVAEPNEIFAVVFLDNQHQVLAYEPLFKGTVDQTSRVSEGGGPACAGAQRFGADPGASAPLGEHRALGR
jgi:DNA repair protein RadC